MSFNSDISNLLISRSKKFDLLTWIWLLMVCSDGMTRQMEIAEGGTPWFRNCSFTLYDCMFVSMSVHIWVIQWKRELTNAVPWKGNPNVSYENTSSVDRLYFHNRVRETHLSNRLQRTSKYIQCVPLGDFLLTAKVQEEETSTFNDSSRWYATKRVNQQHFS